MSEHKAYWHYWLKAFPLNNSYTHDKKNYDSFKKKGNKGKEN